MAPALAYPQQPFCTIHYSTDNCSNNHWPRAQTTASTEVRVGWSASSHVGVPEPVRALKSPQTTNIRSAGTRATSSSTLQRTPASVNYLRPRLLVGGRYTLTKDTQLPSIYRTSTHYTNSFPTWRITVKPFRTKMAIPPRRPFGRRCSNHW